jgi:CubicO group peptidase (beta-lactamase class C family)
MKFSKDGLQQVDAAVRRHVESGAAPGAVALVARGEAVHVTTAGRMALDGPAVARDAIFRIASMTKPFTAVAAMMLVEEGKLQIDEPVARLLPELENRRVLRTLASPIDDTVPAARPITVEDVLTFRLGWGVLFEPDLPIQQAVAGVPGFGMPDPSSPYTPDSFMQRLGELPLMAQPGERWLYTVGSNVLGVLVARAAGKPLDAVIAERICGPLGLTDTAFWVPAEKRGRFVTAYVNDAGKLSVYDKPDGLYARPPSFPAGDSGLVSTIDDFARFAAFLQTGLAPRGERLISASTLQAMQTNRLTPAQMKDGELILGRGWGWGYGLGVLAGDGGYGIGQGAYGWNGGFGTSWFNDPSRDLVAILLTQRFFDSPDAPQIHKDFWRAAVQA